MDTKICSKCKEEKTVDCFYKNGKKNNIQVYRPDCKKCRDAQIETYQKKNPEKYRKWNDISNDRRREAGKYKEYSANRFKTHPHIYREKRAKRRATRLERTPPWVLNNPNLIKQIRDIYRSCPKGYHVDHIIPLKGNNVSGLHVPWNLQYLKAEENLRKSNKV